ncbi:hypothetical protein SDC9_200175 [bioreactor metagenome]|uniref:Uncharacterized protein n=1 Tax=bioreactor metagenome TaxID=1076179 RepID=A0A645IZ83_9ZZZZ
MAARRADRRGHRQQRRLPPAHGTSARRARSRRTAAPPRGRGTRRAPDPPRTPPRPRHRNARRGVARHAGRHAGAFARPRPAACAHPFRKGEIHEAGTVSTSGTPARSGAGRGVSVLLSGKFRPTPDARRRSGSVFTAA